MNVSHGYSLVEMMRVFREINQHVNGFWFEVEPGMLIYAWDKEEALELISNGALPMSRAVVEKKFSRLSEKH